MSKEHNTKITSTPCNQVTLGDCRVKEECPMDGKCSTINAAYDCRVTSLELRKICYKLAEGKWRKGIINTKNNSTTNDIHMRPHF